MREMEIVERLMHFNLTRQEATLYLLLVKPDALQAMKQPNRQAYRVPIPIRHWPGWWKRALPI